MSLQETELLTAILKDKLMKTGYIYGRSISRSKKWSIVKLVFKLVVKGCDWCVWGWGLL